MAYFNFTEHMLKANAINKEMRDTDKTIISLIQDDCTRHEHTIKHYYKKLDDLTQQYLSISKDHLEDF